MSITGSPERGLCIAWGESPTIERCTISDHGQGGVYCYKSSPSLVSCQIIGNTGELGAGIYCFQSSPVLTDCLITENHSLNGGGIYCLESKTILDRCTIAKNAAEQIGGGFFCVGASPILKECTINQNIAGFAGGGCAFEEGSSPELEDCMITENVSMDTLGKIGGVVCFSSSPVLKGCTISSNVGRGVGCSADTFPRLVNCIIEGNIGGGVSCYNRTSVNLVNCLIVGNYSDSNGGGVLIGHDSQSTFWNCTVVGNSALHGDCIYCDGYTSLTLVNSIIWHNGNESISHYDDNISFNLSFSCIENSALWPGAGNIRTDPRFVRLGSYNVDRYKTVDILGNMVSLPDFTLESGDYHLMADSPCIDAGIFSSAPTQDIEEKNRPCADGVDMGAYEFGGCPPLTVQFIRGDPNADNKHDIADAIFILTYLFTDGATPQCLDAADANDSGKIDLADAIKVLYYLFNDSVDNLTVPFLTCGIDPTLDDLDCAVSTCGE